MRMTKHKSELKQTIADNRHMVIATSSKAGNPWVSPVFFAYDEDYNLYWASEKTSRHSKLIQENANIAIVIFDTGPDTDDSRAVYFEASAQELNDKAEAQHAAHIFNARVIKEKFKVKNMEDVLGDGAWRLYKATPTKVFELTDGTEVNGQYVDRRVEIDLS